MSDLSLTIRPERPSDAAAIEKLHERAFGPGRFARTAFRVREGGASFPAGNFVAFVATLIVGSVRLSPVSIDAGKALVLGPLTVDPAFEGRGVGSMLMRAAIDAAKAQGETLIYLVGDEPYYRRFGFKRAPAKGARLPGPVNPARFLVLELSEGALAAASGEMRPARAAE
ncbi:MAG: GNAT family N-acetyltransferase [Rhizobiales bacterium 65-9]|nr:N-acetyltransferase [Hyphomicrobiales bacterium]OJY35878.1 MAG: GNAT family N-acetyltransferase [Rhizobiales bacterium 65-9]